MAHNPTIIRDATDPEGDPELEGAATVLLKNNWIGPVRSHAESDASSDDEERGAGSQRPGHTNPVYYDISGFAHEQSIVQAAAPVRADGDNSDGATGGLTNGEGPDSVDPSKPPPAVKIVPILGTDEDDVIFVTEADIPDNWSHNVYAYDGDDLIVRDRTGGYDSSGGVFQNVHIFDGQGDDVVSYASLSSDVVVDLNLGWAIQQLPDNAGAGAIPYAKDNLYSIETVFGTKFGDIMVGNGSGNRFLGHDGNDVLDGQGGDDTIEGGNGNDTIVGGAGDDELSGNDGHDDIYGEGGADTISGGIGNDNIWGGDQSDLIYGGAGNDEISGGDQSDLIYGGDGTDEISGGNHADTIFDGAGNDDVSGDGGNDILHLGDGNDTVSGGTGADEIHIGGFGDNVVSGGSGVDTAIFGNASVIVNLDINWAQRGTDGVDTITGVENIITGSGSDLLAGTNGHNVIESGGGDDLVSGHDGNDTINGGSGEDTVWGGAGNDDIAGGGNDDELWGQEGVDEIYGEAGNDTLNGGAGIDQISGGADEDRIRGGAGEDWMLGGADADTFVWNAGDVDVPAIDQILDFDINEDMFSFGAGFFDAAPGPINLSSVLVAAPHGGSDSVLWADTDTVAGWQVIARLEGVSAADLNDRIQNGSILNVDTDFEGPGGFELEPLNQGMAEVELPVIDTAPHWDFIV